MAVVRIRKDQRKLGLRQAKVEVHQGMEAEEVCPQLSSAVVQALPLQTSCRSCIPDLSEKSPEN